MLIRSSCEPFTTGVVLLFDILNPIDLRYSTANPHHYISSVIKWSILYESVIDPVSDLTTFIQEVKSIGQLFLSFSYFASIREPIFGRLRLNTLALIIDNVKCKLN